jgi:phosphomevalonate kinase
MVIVSAPGKILLAGGYLVLEESNCGLVVAVNRRFYCQCDAVVVENDDDDDEKDDAAAAALIEEERSSNSSTMTTTIITVQSPQFGSEWHYTWDGTSIQCDANNTSTNLFIEKTLRVVLSYLAAEKSRPQQQQQEHYSTQQRRTTTHLQLKVAADNDFYSLLPHLQQRQLHLCDGDLLPRCLNAAKDSNGTVLKTGLGSSACLVTVLVAALVKTLLYHQEDGDDDDGHHNILLPLDRICALAQVAHCYAQGKIGSGFDVSAACYGSHIYQRFPPAILHDVLAALDDATADTNTADGTAAAAAATHCQTLIQSIVNGHATKIFGNNVQRPVHAFHGDDSFLQVMMADVSMGSESPGMAKAILQWKQQQQQQQEDDDDETPPSSSSIPHWDDLVQLNRTIIELLSQLPAAVAASPPPHQQEQQQPNEDDDEKNHRRRSRFAALPASEWSSQLQADEPFLTPLLLQLRTAFTHARHHLKELGEAANVPVEPDIQTALCNATSQLPGVLATLVPGAGGYDAVVCIYINDRTVRDAIAQFWTQDWMTQQQQQQQQDGAIVPVVPVVCPLTVAGVDHGQGLLVEDQFPLATIV